MTDRPILFSEPMARALLAGRKTATRRILKPQPTTVDQAGCWYGRNPESLQNRLRYAVGDRLWVREAWSAEHVYTGTKPRDILAAAGCVPPPVWYWADGSPEYGDWTKPKPGMFMPRWASRLTLTVTAVKVERLQDISEEDARAEGAYIGKASGRVADNYVTMALAGRWFSSARRWYEDLWNRLHGPEAWALNPFVVATTFTVRKGNIDDQIP